MKVIYVAGRFTAPDTWQRMRNVRRAEALGYAVAELGAMPLIPHANTANFDGTFSIEFWYEGTLELLRRCDAMILVPGHEGSKGVASEIAEAKRLHLPVFERVDELKTWLSSAAQLVYQAVRARKARAFDDIVEAGRTSDSKMTFVDTVDDIVEVARVDLREIPDPLKENV